MQFETIIGLEIHVQLKTKSKMYCRCSNDGENQAPNTTICPICMAHPGTLPVLNHQAVRLGIKCAKALKANINKLSEFSRKNYFYPDLPKGYQITQDDKPLAEGGHLPIYFDNEWQNIKLERLHLEEDSAKNLHSSDGQHSWIDYNRAGSPLLEIVTKPKIKYPAQAKLFLENLQMMLKSLNISDANMEKGQLRCDANISLRPTGDKKYYPKTEVKNLNSFKAVEKALIYEIKRQKKLWEDNNPPQKSETRGWDEKKNKTISQRSKETLNDYRYFPEPDLPILRIDDELIQDIAKTIKNLPWKIQKRLLDEYKLDLDSIYIFLKNPKQLAYFEHTISELQSWLKAENTKIQMPKIAKISSNYIINDIPPLLEKSEQSWANLALSAENMAELIKMILQKEINKQQGQDFLSKMILSKKDVDPSHLLDDIKAEMKDFDLTKTIDKVITEHPDEVEKYKNGNPQLIKFFLGQVMRLSKGQANPQETETILKEKLK